MKKLVVSLMLIVVCFSSTLSFAEVSNQRNFKGSDVVKPEAELTCSYYGTHKMKNTNKWVIVKYNNKAVMTYAGEYMCDCGEVVVCMGRPGNGQLLGNYFTGSQLYGRQYADGFTQYFSTTPSPNYTSNSYLKGYDFLQVN